MIRSGSFALLIDRDEVALLALREYLRLRGVCALGSATGHRADVIARAIRFDVVVIGNPPVDFDEGAFRVRRLSRGGPVVVREREPASHQRGWRVRAEEIAELVLAALAAAPPDEPAPCAAALRPAGQPERRGRARRESRLALALLASGG